MKLTKCIINSIIIKDTDGSPDPKKLISWETEKDDETISEAELILPRNVNDLVDLKNGQLVEIWAGWTTSTDKRYFYGYIDNIKPEGALITVTCKNEMIMLVRKNVNKIYESGADPSAGEVSEIVEDLIETYGGMTATVQSSGTEDGKKIDQFKCINADIFERVMTLKKALDWELYYNDSDRKVYFEPLGYNDSGKILTVGTEIVGLPEWGFDTNNMINDLRIDGASVPTDITESGQIGTGNYTTTGITLTHTPDVVELYMDVATPPTTQKIGGSKDASTGHFYYVDRENKKVMPKTGTTFTTNHYAEINYVRSSEMPIHMINQKSIDDYGIYEKQIELSDVSSVADAESRAINILSKRSVPFITGKLLIKSQSANIPNRGETVNIVDTRTPTVNGLTLSGEYVVNKIKYKFPSAIEEIEVGDKTWRLADWQTNTEERLKRLEEQFVRNQDIIMELVDTQNDPITVEPRYRQIIKETMADGSNFILSHSSQGLLGSDVLGRQADVSTNHFIQQFENNYTENFIDTDFFDDPNSTGAWLTGIIADTETLRSLPIDFGNGTISSATATFTESGAGTPTFYLSADGGSNWETVTSGTAHTFSNTGTSLMWRVDSASGTTTLTKVIISDYH